MSALTNGTLLQYFHWYLPADHKHWKKLAADAPVLAETGITAVWLPPATKANVALKSVGYDIYDLYDLGEFNQKGGKATKYGTKLQYVNAVKQAHKAGIQVFADVVLNHKAGADETEKVMVEEVDPLNRNEVISTEPFTIEAFTKFTFPGRKGKYSEFIWDYHCFTGTDYDHNTGNTGIYRILNEYGANGWEQTITEENGNYDYLMFSDIDFRNPYVREELKKWIKWYHETTGFNGLRLDAVKHIPARFFNEWIDYIKSFVPENPFTVIGEFWTYDLDHQLKYIEETEGRIQLFDSCLHLNFYNAAHQGREYDLTTIFHNTLVSVHPVLAVTLVDNHDTQPLQDLESYVEPWFKPLAYALILLREAGYPCVFYPDMYGVRYSDFGRDGNTYEIDIPVTEKINILLRARKHFAYGIQKDYLDHPNCIGWVRQGQEGQAGLAVLMSNGEDGFKRMDMGSSCAGAIFRDVMEYITEVVIADEEGWADFRCAGGKVSVWIREDAL